MTGRRPAAFLFAIPLMTLVIACRLAAADFDASRLQLPRPKLEPKSAPPEVPESGLPGMSELAPGQRMEPIPIPMGGFRSPLFGGRPQKVFKFEIDPMTPVRDLLPAQPAKMPKAPALFNEDLSQVRELMLSEPLSTDLDADEAMQKIAHLAAKINHLNAKDADRFIRELSSHRRDLHGLPFVLGKECRTDMLTASAMMLAASDIRLATRSGPSYGALWDWLKNPERRSSGKNGFAVAATLMQMVIPGTDHYGAGLPKSLDRMEDSNATQALANLAIFSPESEVRAEAIKSLSKRPLKDYVSLLLRGFRYPLPAVSQRAADAIIQLKCKEAIPGLIEVLDRPDSRAPQRESVDGKALPVMRELVRVNHHRNCLLCHAPAESKESQIGLMTGTIPLPGEPFPQVYYSMPRSPDLLVRFDVTYLRQDFSMLMPVADAAPWPEMQRFDFLVRTRVLTTAEEAQIRGEFAKVKDANPYHRHALNALRRLTGQDAGMSAKAWRDLLALAGR